MIQVHFSQSLWQAIDFFLSSPDQQDIAHHKMDAMEWFVLRDFEVILEVSILILMHNSTKMVFCYNSYL